MDNTNPSDANQPADSSGGMGSGDTGGGYTPPVSEPAIPAEETPAETPAETPSQEPVSTPEPEQGNGNAGGDAGGDQNPAGGTPGM